MRNVFRFFIIVLLACVLGSSIVFGGLQEAYDGAIMYIPCDNNLTDSYVYEEINESGIHSRAYINDSGIVGKACIFTNNQPYINSLNDYNLNETYTIDFWAWAKSTDQYDAVFQIRNPSAYVTFFLVYAGTSSLG